MCVCVCVCVLEPAARGQDAEPRVPEEYLDEGLYLDVDGRRKKVW